MKEPFTDLYKAAMLPIIDQHLLAKHVPEVKSYGMLDHLEVAKISEI